MATLVRLGDRGGEIRRGESGRAKRIEFFRREDDSMASGRGLDAGGKTSLNGVGGRLWRFRVGLELEIVAVDLHVEPTSPELGGRMVMAAMRMGRRRMAYWRPGGTGRQSDGKPLG